MRGRKIAISVAVVALACEGSNPGGRAPSASESSSNFLGQCRFYSSMQPGAEPDWDRAKTACEQALEADPLNSEGRELLRKVRFELRMRGHYEKGQTAIERSEEERALEDLRQIERHSYYYAKGKILTTGAIDGGVTLVVGATASRKDEVRRLLNETHAYSEIAIAVESYWANRVPEAKSELQRLLSTTGRADAHAFARDALRSVERAAALKIDGEMALQRDDLNGAERRFAEALRHDSRLTAGIPATHPSEIRKSIQRSFAKKAFELGNRWADQGDFRKACAYWRRGSAYDRGNADLPRARRGCSEIAKATLDEASSCGGLARVLDFAMDGDGIKEKVNAKQVELKCR